MQQEGILYAGFIFFLEKEREPVGTGSEARDPGRPHAVEAIASEQARGRLVQGPRQTTSQHYPAPTPSTRRFLPGRIHPNRTGQKQKRNATHNCRSGVEISTARTSDRNGHEIDQKVQRDLP
jgi:hypothetical protein